MGQGSGKELEPLYEDDDMMMDQDSQAFGNMDEDDGVEFSLARPPTPTHVFRTSTPLSPPPFGVDAASHTPFGAHTQPQVSWTTGHHPDYWTRGSSKLYLSR